MRSIYDTRRDALRQLVQTWGGPTSLAEVKRWAKPAVVLASCSLMVDAVFIALALN